MQQSIKIGSIIGLIGLLSIIGISLLGGINLGIIIFLITSGAAGFLTAKKVSLITQQDIVRSSTIAGGIAGLLVLIGQLIASVLIIIIGPTVVTSGAGDIFFQFGPILIEPGSRDMSFEFGLEVGRLTGRSICFGLPFALGLSFGIGLLFKYFQKPQTDDSTQK